MCTHRQEIAKAESAQQPGQPPLRPTLRGEMHRLGAIFHVPLSTCAAHSWSPQRPQVLPNNLEGYTLCTTLGLRCAHNCVVNPVASVMFVAEIIIMFGFDRNYTVITYQYTVRNVVTDRRLRLRQR